jgi:branched-chain amino acid transport system permease protein
MYYVVLAVFVARVLFVIRIVHSPFGQVLKAIRENEPRAISLGYDVDRYKLLAFVLSTALAGWPARLKTLVLGFATLTDGAVDHLGTGDPDDLVGGMGTMSGPSSARWSSSRSRTRSATSAARWRSGPTSTGSTAWASR